METMNTFGKPSWELERDAAIGWGGKANGNQEELR